MVEARAQFLAAGHMRPLTEALAASLASEPAPRHIVELGSGTGHYLGALAAHASARCATGLDLSKAATARAARDHPDCLFAVADVEAQVPVTTGSSDLVVSVFAPRPADEIKRIAREGGMLLVAAAGERHLEALRRRFGLMSIRPGKLEELQRRLLPEFVLISSQPLEYRLELSPSDCRAAVMMGPNAHHRDAPPEPQEGTTDTASVLVACFRRQARGG